MFIARQVRVYNWQNESLLKMAKKHHTTVSKLTRLAISLFLCDYKGKYSKEYMDDINFKARMKINNK